MSKNKKNQAMDSVAELQTEQPKETEELQTEQLGEDVEVQVQQPSDVTTVRIRTAVWQGKRLEQRRRSDLTAFTEWQEVSLTAEQLAAIKADVMIEVEA